MTIDASRLTVLHPTQEHRSVLAQTPAEGGLRLVLQEVHDRTFGHILRHDIGTLFTEDDPADPLGVVVQRFGPEGRSEAYDEFIALARREPAAPLPAGFVPMPVVPGVVHLQVPAPCLLYIFPDTAWAALPEEVRRQVRPLMTRVEGLGFVATGPIDPACRCGGPGNGGGLRS